MASSSKKRTTMAKLNRENAVRERRLRKEARKAERKRSPHHLSTLPDRLWHKAS
jgi:hypothetical protein